MGLGGEGGQRRKKEEQRRKESVEIEEPTLLLFREVFSLNCTLLGVREGKRDELRLNQVEYNNRLNHRKLLFLKVRNDLISAILCVSAILESKEMIM